MPKDYSIYLNDIIDSIEKIRTYTRGISYEEFIKNSLIADGVMRNLEIIGEAVKKLPPGMKRKYSGIEWKKIAGLRDILIHEYSGIDMKIVWDVVDNKMPELKVSIKGIMKGMKA